MAEVKETMEENRTSHYLQCVKFLQLNRLVCGPLSPDTVARIRDGLGLDTTLKRKTNMFGEGFYEWTKDGKRVKFGVVYADSFKKTFWIENMNYDFIRITLHAQEGISTVQDRNPAHEKAYHDPEFCRLFESFGLKAEWAMRCISC